MVFVNALILDPDPSVRSLITRAISEIPAIKISETAVLWDALEKAKAMQPSIIILGMTVGFSELGRYVAALRSANAKTFICWVSGRYDVRTEKLAFIREVNAVFDANDFEALIQNISAVCGEIACNGVPYFG